ncbi:MAG: PorV/PorQ family protein, partial [Bacteroidia bacterium]
MKSIATLLLLFFTAQLNAQILPAFGGSRSGTTGMQFLKIGPDARSNALAGSVVGEVNDAASIFWNPAGAVELDSQKLHIQTGNVQYFGGIGLNHGVLVYQPEKFKSFSVGVMNFRSPEMDITTEFMPQGTGQTYALNDLMLALSYSQVLTDNFRFGISLKYANENIMGVVSQAGLFDFGFQYRVGVKDLMFGVAISNFGFNVNPQGEIELITLNGLVSVNQFEEIAVPASFKMGFS